MTPKTFDFALLFPRRFIWDAMQNRRFQQWKENLEYVLLPKEGNPLWGAHSTLCGRTYSQKKLESTD
jgi:hypothetical protein